MGIERTSEPMQLFWIDTRAVFHGRETEIQQWLEFEKAVTAEVFRKIDQRELWRHPQSRQRIGMLMWSTIGPNNFSILHKKWTGAQRPMQINAGISMFHRYRTCPVCNLPRDAG